MMTLQEWEEREVPLTIAIDENVNGRIIAGMSAGREGQGCTETLFQMAKRLAQDPMNRVIVVDLNLAEPCMDKYFGLNSASLIMHLDALYKRMTGKVTKEMILENVINQKGQRNLFLLPGTRRPFSADSFSANVLNVLLMALKQLYDVVLVDVSSHFDNPGTVAGLISADIVLVFSNYQADGLRIFNLYYDTLFARQPSIKDKLQLVGVETVKGRKENLEQLCQVPVAGHLPHVPELQRFTSTGQIGQKAEKKYLQGLDRLLDQLIPDKPTVRSQVAERKWRLWPIRQS